MVRVLVTGGAGFIGSHLTPALLRAGFEVRILDNLSPQIHGALPSGPGWLGDGSIVFIRASVTSEKDMRAAVAGVDAVVHLAAETGTGQSTRSPPSAVDSLSVSYNDSQYAPASDSHL